MGVATSEGTVERRVEEPVRTPVLSLVLGWAPMVPYVFGLLVAWSAGGGTGRVAATLTVLWGGVILIFLAGVRRGLSFRTEGGPTAFQIVTVLALFVTGLVAPVAFLAGAVAPACGLLVAAYLGLAVLDPIASRRGEAPPFFARLRPLQMMVPALSFLGLLVVAT